MKLLVPPPLVVVVVAAAMWGVSEALAFGSFSFTGQTVVASLLLVAAVALMLAAVVALIRARTTVNPFRPERTSHLVTSGVFGISRNPIYLADLLVLAAAAIWLGNFGNILLPGIFVWYMNRFQIAAEERALEGRFGERYAAYRAAVRRWI